MYRIIKGNTKDLSDVEMFIETVNGSEGQALFDRSGKLVVTRAPGRLDVMGGIADYSGSLVLELPTTEATHVALQRDDSNVLKMVSLGAEENDRALDFEMAMSDFDGMDYDAAQAFFKRDSSRSWAAYAAGVFLVLMRERNVHFEGGVRMLISSDVPEGKGVSSSAAIEVAVMQAVSAAFDVAIEPRELAILCQKVENLVVGAPCGVMDQVTSSCGQADQLVALLCQPAELQDSVSIPDDVAFWGIDSGIRHAVSGADYGSVRVGAFMGYRILANLAGLEVTEGRPLQIDDPNWRGCLANVTPALFEQLYGDALPEQMKGADFLSQYGGTTDAVTQVDPERNYAVQVPARHPIHEHFRVQTFAQLLQYASSEQVKSILGELMFQAHASYSACGLGSEGTDRLVELVREAGVASGLYGAKITGGGSGGTVAILGLADSDDIVQEIANRYAEETEREPYIFSGSSPGAAAFDHVVMEGDGEKT
ncbi:MAG: GHMP kinase [Candidatus Latescibacteria bacterium]|jgi:L-arabinokinase|nr:GHMP kinase [Candidatus Latescibacterota bacterium]